MKDKNIKHTQTTESTQAIQWYPSFSTSNLQIECHAQSFRHKKIHTQ